MSRKTDSSDESFPVNGPLSPASQPELDWEKLDEKQHKEKAPWRLLSFLKWESRFESFLYVLSNCIISGSIFTIIFTYFPPMALVILGSLSVGGATAVLGWKLSGDKTKLYQKFLIIIAALMLAGLFIIGINFAAFPLLGITGVLTGQGFFIAATQVSLYLIIGLGILKALISGFLIWRKHAQQNHYSNLKNTHWLAKILGLRFLTELGASYSAIERLYLVYGLAFSSLMGIAAGALSYYGLMQSLPLALVTLGVGVSLSHTLLIPLAWLFFSITLLMVAKRVMAVFIRNAEQKKQARSKADYVPSHVEALMAQHRHIDFVQQPLIKLSYILHSFWNAYFSFDHYLNYQQHHHPSRLHLNKNEFRINLFFNLTLFLPFQLLGFFLKPLISSELKKHWQEKMAQQLFWRKPLTYIFHFFKFTYEHLFTYAGYKKLYPDSDLTQTQFYLRNLILFIFVPIAVSAIIFNLYIQVLDPHWLSQLFNISEASAIFITMITNGLLATLATPAILATTTSGSQIIDSTVSSRPKASATTASASAPAAVPKPTSSPQALKRAPPSSHQYRFTPADPPGATASNALNLILGRGHTRSLRK